MKEKEKEAANRSIDRISRFEHAVRRAGECASDLMLEAQITGGAVEATVWGSLCSVFKEIYRLCPWDMDLESATSKGPVEVVRAVTKPLSEKIAGIGDCLEEEMKVVSLERVVRVKQSIARAREKFAASTRQDMLLPEQQLSSLRRMLIMGHPAYVTKTLGDQGKYQAGEEVNSRFGVLRVVAVNTYKKASGHPFPSTVPDPEKKVLDVAPFDVIELERA